jgi:hypothetical protein
MMRSRTWGGYGARCPGLKSKPREVPPLQNEAGIPVGGIPSCPVLTSAYSERARWRVRRCKQAKAEIVSKDKAVLEEAGGAAYIDLTEFDHV